MRALGAIGSSNSRAALPCGDGSGRRFVVRPAAAAFSRPQPQQQRQQQRPLHATGGACACPSSAAASAPRASRGAASGRSRARAVRSTAMFTGIVQGRAEVVAVDSRPGFSQVNIRLPPGRAEGIQIGASVAINGTCLTVTAADGDVLSFDIMAETLRATNLGGLEAGRAVNYERSARVGDEIGGHNVSGHVHTTAAIKAVEESPDNRRVVFELPDEAWMKYILPKGFIAVDGCSLTVGEVEGRTFSVYLIPETLRVTVFGLKGVGDSVNIEVEAQTQAIVDTVERVVARYMAQRGL